MKRTTDNPMAGFFEAQMAGTTDIMRATLDGMQRLQEITLRALREGAGGQMNLARSLTDARDPADLTRAQTEHAGPASEQARRIQQELLQAITEMNGEVIRASYSMMERLSGAMAESSAAMGVQLPAGGGGTAGMQSPLAMYEAGLKQWQNAVQQMSHTMMPGAQVQADDDEDDDDSDGGTATRSKAASKRKSGRR